MMSNGKMSGSTASSHGDCYHDSIRSSIDVRKAMIDNSNDHVDLNEVNHTVFRDANFSLRREFDNEAIQTDVDDDSENDHLEDDLPPPAPPSPLSNEDNVNDNEYDYTQENGDEDQDDENSAWKNECSEHEETFDTLDDFGEDTLHALLDADLRLSAVPPLSTVKQQQQRWQIEAHGFCQSSEGEKAREKTISQEAFDEEKMNKVHYGQFDSEGDVDRKGNDSFNFNRVHINANEKVDDVDDEVSSSLLRAPLMAAKSFVAMTANVTTPYATGSQSMSMQKASNSYESSTLFRENYSSKLKNDATNIQRNLHSDISSTTHNENLYSVQSQKLAITESMIPHHLDDASKTASFSFPKLQVSTSMKQKCTPALKTPSTARNEFLLSSVEKTSQSLRVEKPVEQASSMKHSANLNGVTPSNLVIMTQSKHRPPLKPLSSNMPHSQLYSKDITPSAARTELILSPVDSVSTIGVQSAFGGSNEHMVHYNRVKNPTNSIITERLNSIATLTPSEERRKYIDSPQNSLVVNPLPSMIIPMTLKAHDLGSGFNNVTASDNESGFSDDKKSSFQVADNNTSNSAIKAKIQPESVEHLIALGEQQIKLSSSMDIKSNERPLTTLIPPKKSFLRKGTRKEPSALHTIEDIHTQQMKSFSSECDPTRSESERKARLASLEKMQQDLMNSLERRMARKEEAQRERRNTKMSEVRSQGVITKAQIDVVEKEKRTSIVSGSRKMADVGPSVKTSSQIRPRSVSRGKKSSEQKKELKNSIPTTSRARAISALESGRRPVECSTTPSQTPDDKPQSLSATSDDAARYQINDASNVCSERNAVQINHLETNSTRTTDLEDSRITQPPQHDRSRSTSRPKSGNPESNFRSKPSILNNADAEQKALEEWKRKEEEQWALIKNMRKRQEVALREAEGERERAKAWAAAERESTMKWVEEQRALIIKDRHKAANASLLAAKKAMKDNGNTLESAENKALKTELEELKSAMKKMKEELDKSKKITNKLPKQETSNNATKIIRGDLTSPKYSITERNETRGPLSESTTSKKQKSQNMSSKPKQFKSEKIATIKEARLKVPKDVIIEDNTEGATVIEDSTDHWLQRNLAALKSANNALDNKILSAEQNTATIEDGKIYSKLVMGQNKPYNPADYMCPEATTGSPFLVAASAPQVHEPKATSDGAKKSQVFTYKNGTQKEVLPDGTITISFVNGDRKRTYANEKKGIVVYYYAATKTTQVTHQDGTQTYHFPNKQVENHYIDGRKEITFPDGTKRTIYNDGTSDTTFPDGVRVVERNDN